MQGVIDENVHFCHTSSLVQHLVNAGKPYQLQVIIIIIIINSSKILLFIETRLHITITIIIKYFMLGKSNNLVVLYIGVGPALLPCCSSSYNNYNGVVRNRGMGYEKC